MYYGQYQRMSQVYPAGQVRPPGGDIVIRQPGESVSIGLVAAVAAGVLATALVARWMTR